MDPTAPIHRPSPVSDVSPSPTQNSEASLGSLLQTQLQVAQELQKKLLGGSLDALPPRDLKEMVNSVSTLLTLAHRTGQADQEIRTYRLYVDIVNDFLRRRGDSLGEDLAAELRQVASEYQDAPTDLLPDDAVLM